jgi:Ca2+-binding RTX toxin-like protein
MRWACGMLVLLVFGAGAAEATTVDFRTGDGRFTTDRYLVDGGPLQNEIEIAYKASTHQFVISDTAQPVETTDCARETLHRVRCDNAGYQMIVATEDGRDRVEFLGRYGGFDEVIIFGGAGDDRLSAGPKEQDLTGGAGRDVVLGGGGGDFVSGGPGADLLFGGLGDDFVGGTTSEDGPDRMFGGPGNDDLAANQDGHRDRKLDCGPGHDEARIERIDPRPSHCERVRVIG